MSDATQELRDQAPAYVLGGLSADEARAFEAAMARDPELRREVAEFREVAALLATRESAAPGPGLKQRLMERVGAAKSVDLDERRGAKRRSAGSTLLGLGLAASVVVAGALGLQVQRLRSDLAGRDSVLAVRAARVTELERQRNAIFEPGVDLTLLTRPGDRPPGIQIFRDRDRRRLMLHAFRLTQAAPGRAYQLWLLPRGGQPIPSHVFNADADGHYLAEDISLPDTITIEGYALTEEPAGGSPQPTTPILLVGRIAGT